MANTTAQWNVAVGTGVLRLAAGTSLIAAGGFGAHLLGAERDDELVTNVVLGLGARDCALGVMALAATRPGLSVPGAVLTQAASDVLDTALLAGLASTGRIARSRAIPTMLVSLASAALNVGLARHARRPPGLSLSG